jgi:hypothetical protein
LTHTEKRLTAWWAILSVATVASWETGAASDTGRMLAVAGVLALTFAKVMIVIFQYMDVREAPAPLRLGLAAWSVATPVAIGFVWFGAAGA